MLPEDQEERAKLKSQINEKKEDLKKVLDVTQVCLTTESILRI